MRRSHQGGDDQEQQEQSKGVTYVFFSSNLPPLTPKIVVCVANVGFKQKKNMAYNTPHNKMANDPASHISLPPSLLAACEITSFPLDPPRTQDSVHMRVTMHVCGLPSASASAAAAAAPAQRRVKNSIYTILNAINLELRRFSSALAPLHASSPLPNSSRGTQHFPPHTHIPPSPLEARHMWPPRLGFGFMFIFYALSTLLNFCCYSSWSKGFPARPTWPL